VTPGPIGLPHYLVVSALLFGLGLFTVATRKNAVGILMGVELLFNAAGLNLVAFSQHQSGQPAGLVFSVFVIVTAAAEAAVALAIVLSVWRRFRSIDADDTSALRG